MTLRLRLILPLLGALLLSTLLSAAQPALRPNLRGEAMILVYHRFGDTDHRWTRAWSSFDRDLAHLYADGYRPITLHQYVTGDFVLPAGTSPVVITFDDSSDNQLKFTPDGKLDPNCAVAHWLAFAHTHPDFPMHGVFFLNSGYNHKLTFEQPQFARQKVQMILQLGGEIGNHTLTHANLKTQGSIAAREIALGQYDINELLPGYRIHSFALPFGIYPNPQNLSWQGEWTNPKSGAPHEVQWSYDAVVKVGAGPAKSPFVKGFDPLHLPRIQAFDPEIDRWLAYFEKHPERRLVSDGQRHAPASIEPATVAHAAHRRSSPRRRG